MAGKSNFIVRGGADFSGIKKEIQRTQATMANFQERMSKTMSAVGKILGTITVGKLIKDSTAVAMGVESAMDNINRNMKNSSKAFQEWVNAQSKPLGLAKAEAYKYGSTFSNLLGSFQKDAKQTADSTQELMKAAAIISSKTGRTYDDTANRIRSGMLGSTEAIEDLGVYTNISMIESTEAFKKFAGSKSWAQLDFQTQQQIRLAAILEQTYARYGDTLADTTTTRQNQFVASLKNAQLSLGQAFLPIYNAVLPALTRMAEALGAVINKIAQFSQALFGKANVGATQNTEEQVAAVSGLGDASEKTGKQAKKAQSILAGFDELNVLSKPSETQDTTNVGGNTTTSVSQIDGLSGEIGVGVIISPDLQNSIDKLKESMQPTIEAVNRLKEALQPLKDFAASSLEDFYNNFLAPISKWTFGEGLPRFIDAVSNGLSKINWQPIKDGLNNLWEALTPFAINIGEGLLWLWENVLVPLGTWTINTVVPNFFNILAEALKIVNAAIEVLKPLGQWLWDNFLQPLAEWTGGLIASSLEKIAETFKKISDWISENKTLVEDMAIVVGSFAAAWGLVNLAFKAWNIAVTVWNSIGAIAAAVTTAFGAAVAFLTSPITLVVIAIGAIIAIGVLLIKHWDEVKDAASKCWDWIKDKWSKAGEWFSTTVVEPIKTFFAGLWEDIKLKASEAWESIKTIWSIVSTWFNDTVILPVTIFFINLKNSISTLFSNAWTSVKNVWIKASNWFKDNVIDPIGDGFKSGINFMIGLVEGFVNSFLRGVNKIIGALNSISIDVPEGVPFIGGTKFGISIPTVREISIPRLATGAVIPPNSEFLAILGDQKSGRNIEAPEGLIRQIVREETAGMMQGGDLVLENNMYLDGDVVFKNTKKIAWEEFKRSGESPFPVY